MAEKYLNIKTGRVVSLNADYLPISLLNDLKPYEVAKPDEIPDILKENNEPIKRRRHGKDKE